MSTLMKLLLLVIAVMGVTSVVCLACFVWTDFDSSVNTAFYYGSIGAFFIAVTLTDHVLSKHADDY